jgi:YD repeat-containing protein
VNTADGTIVQRLDYDEFGQIICSAPAISRQSAAELSNAGRC